MSEWEGTKYGLLPNMAGKHELEKIKLREEIARLKGQAESIANVTHCSKPECIETAEAYLEQDAEITRLNAELQTCRDDLIHWINEAAFQKRKAENALKDNEREQGNE